MKSFTDDTVVAKRIGSSDYYHKGCAPDNASDVKAGNEEDVFDPQLLNRACLECGRWILTGVRSLAYQEYCEQRVKDDGVLRM